MTRERMSDEEIVEALPDEVLAELSAEQRAALDHVLARLAAAEKVCGLVKVGLSPKLRKSSGRKLYWWDVAIAVKEWEEITTP
jgi:hypothetical protein